MATQDPSSMLQALHAGGPAPDRAPQMMLYGRFVGSWEGHVVDHLPDGTRREMECEVHFGWVLEGRAVQDVWIVPSRKTRKLSEPLPCNLYGTTLRVYDPQKDFWHITWLNPVTQAFETMTARQAGDDIVQEYRARDGILCQWVFDAIASDSFHWVKRESSDGGATWKVQREYFMRKKVPDDAAVCL